MRWFSSSQINNSVQLNKQYESDNYCSLTTINQNLIQISNLLSKFICYIYVCTTTTIIYATITAWLVVAQLHTTELITLSDTRKTMAMHTPRDAATCKQVWYTITVGGDDEATKHYFTHIKTWRQIIQMY